MGLLEEIEELRELTLKAGEAVNRYWQEKNHKEVHKGRPKSADTLKSERAKIVNAAWRDLNQILENLVNAKEASFPVDTALQSARGDKPPTRAHMVSKFSFYAGLFEEDSANIDAIEGLNWVCNRMVQHYCRVQEGWYDKQSKNREETLKLGDFEQEDSRTHPKRTP